jgi:hypothetical protein
MLAIRRYTAMGALETAFGVCRAHFGLLFTISLIVSVPPALATAVMDVKSQSVPEDPLAGAPLVLVALVASVLGSAFATAASTRVVSRAVLGERPTLRRVVGETIAIFGRVIPAVLLATLVISGLALLMAATVLATIAGAGSGGLLLGVVLGIGVVAVLGRIWMSWILVVPITAFEPVGARAAMHRSARLMSGRRLKVFGAMLRLVILAAVAQFGATLLSALVPGEGIAVEAYRQLVVGAGSAVVAPLMHVALVLFYFDARVDLEAFDAEELARLIGPTPAA